MNGSSSSKKEKPRKVPPTSLAEMLRLANGGVHGVRTTQLRRCVDEVTVRAIEDLLARPRIYRSTVKAWLIDEGVHSDDDESEQVEAVQHMLRAYVEVLKAS